MASSVVVHCRHIFGWSQVFLDVRSQAVAYIFGFIAHFSAVDVDSNSTHIELQHNWDYFDWMYDFGCTTVGNDTLFFQSFTIL